MLTFETLTDTNGSHNKYFQSKTKIADYNVMINGINLFNKAINNEIKISRSR